MFLQCEQPHLVSSPASPRKKGTVSGGVCAMFTIRGIGLLDSSRISTVYRSLTNLT